MAPNLKKNSLSYALLFCLGFSFSQSFAAGPFDITITSYGKISSNSTLLSSFITEIDRVVLDMENEVNKSLPDANPKTYLKGMSNSNTLATKGLGVDYASQIDIFVVGAGVGIGADIGNNSFSDVISGDIDANQLQGVGAQGAVMAGINLGVFPMPTLGPVDLNKMKLFVSFFQLKDIDKDISGGKFKGEIGHFGTHLSYPVWEGMDLPFFMRWGGINVTTGFDYAKFNVNYSKTFSENKTRTATVANPLVSGSTLTADLLANFTGTARAGADVSVYTIPIEVSTNIQILHVFGFFGGLGVDLNSGEAKSITDLNGNVTVTDSTGLVADGATPITARATLDLGSVGEPDSFSARWFGGVQLNASVLKLYAQVNSVIGEDLWGVNIGTRIAY